MPLAIETKIMLMTRYSNKTLKWWICLELSQMLFYCWIMKDSTEMSSMLVTTRNRVLRTGGIFTRFSTVAGVEMKRRMKIHRAFIRS